MINKPRWCLSITHQPTGTTVKTDSRFYRDQDLARRDLMRLMRYKLSMLGYCEDHLKIEYY